MIKFRCAACGQKLGVPEDYAGRLVKCTGCASPARVPGEIEGQSPPSAASAPADDFESFDDFEEVDDLEEIEEDDLEVLEEEDDFEEIVDFGAESTSTSTADTDDPIAALAQFDTAPKAAPQQWQQPAANPQMASAPPAARQGSSKQWMLTSAHISFWSAMAIIPLSCCIPFALTLSGFFVGGQIFGLSAWVAIIVAVVCGIIGIAGAKHFPGRGAMWRSVTGLIVGGIFLVVFGIFLVLGMTMLAIGSQAQQQRQNQQQSSSGQWGQVPQDAPD